MTQGPMMTEEDLEAIEARTNAATVGPWSWRERRVSADTLRDEFGTAALVAHDTTKADGLFIAAARTDVPALVAEVRRLRHHLMVLETDGDPAGTATEAMLGRDTIRALGLKLAEVQAEADRLRALFDGFPCPFCQARTGLACDSCGHLAAADGSLKD